MLQETKQNATIKVRDHVVFHNWSTKLLASSTFSLAMSARSTSFLASIRETFFCRGCQYRRHKKRIHVSKHA